MEKEYLKFIFKTTSTQVIARFYFVNTNTQQAVTQLTGFPDIALGIEKAKKTGRFSEPYPSNAYVGTTYSPLENLTTLLNGIEIPSEVKFGYVDNTDWVPSTDQTGDLVAWYVVQMIIPPGGHKILERRYETDNPSHVPCTEFTYITHTGGGWHGTIGELKADLVLGEGTDGDDFDFEPPLTEWKKTGKNTMSLVWTDFDPRLDSSKQQIYIKDCASEAELEKMSQDH